MLSTIQHIRQKISVNFVVFVDQQNIAPLFIVHIFFKDPVSIQYFLSDKIVWLILFHSVSKWEREKSYGIQFTYRVTGMDRNQRSDILILGFFVWLNCNRECYRMHSTPVLGTWISSYACSEKKKNGIGINSFILFTNFIPDPYRNRTVNFIFKVRFPHLNMCWSFLKHWINLLNFLRIIFAQ